jgi:hypothetical protein
VKTVTFIETPAELLKLVRAGKARLSFHDRSVSASLPPDTKIEADDGGRTFSVIDLVRELMDESGYPTNWEQK